MEKINTDSKDESNNLIFITSTELWSRKGNNDKENDTCQ